MTIIDSLAIRTGKNNLQKPIYFLSGIPPGPSGTGEWLRYIEREGGKVLHGARFSETGSAIRSRAGIVSQLLKSYAADRLNRKFLRSFPALAKRDDCEFVLVHPQTIGLRRAYNFLKSRTAPTYYYLLDNSFFCIRSYNYIPTESGPCLRCLGGDLRSAKGFNCRPFPVPREDFALDFVRGLHSFVRDGSVKLLAQSKSHSLLAERHFGVSVPVVGLWANGWDECLNVEVDPNPSYRWDVVFHGWHVPAKGADWLLEVARHCPDLKFLMPFACNPDLAASLPNCTFRQMTWENGLRDEIKAARITAVPSLWSASIEGALLKSIACAPAVSVLQNDTAYSSELPSELLLRMPKDAASAAERLRWAVSSGWQPDPHLRKYWLEQFVSFNRSMYERLIGIISANHSNN